MEVKELKLSIEKLLSKKDLKDQVSIINEIREYIHILSPFKDNPVDYVKWEISENIVSNDYNPNKVAPPEMELLELSIINDGYTQPIVTWRNDNGKTEVIDGFHRNRVGKESIIVNQRVFNYLPVVNIRKDQSDKNDRIASTIRHNRARGKHQVNAMSEIVIELKNRNWANNRIAKQLGMEEEEVLRLCQISGLEELFSDKDFSQAWEADGDRDFYEVLSDEIEDTLMDLYKIPNEADTKRIYHTYDKWECHKHGFYNSKHNELTKEECVDKYIETLTDINLFESILNKIINEWKFSCEHYLSNNSMNRIAWLGQASVCYQFGVPSSYSYAWFELTADQQNLANLSALKYLNIWLEKNGFDKVDLNKALLSNRQIELY